MFNLFSNKQKREEIDIWKFVIELTFGFKHLTF